MPHEIDLADVGGLTGGDGLCVWPAQGAARAFASHDRRAVAVAGPALSRRDRMAVHGDPGALVPLVGAVLDEVGPTFRPLGDRHLIRALADGLPDVKIAGEFAWMERGRDGTELPDENGARWLDEADTPEIAALIDTGFPDSYARPDVPGVNRWSGIRDASGHLVAVAAEAWSAPTVGLLSGVAVHPSARGTGLGARICAFTVAEILADRGRCGLMVDDWNEPAQRVYRTLGFSFRPVAACAVTSNER
ncbi:GNAT family N-acetyltransferase [Yinghuangia seranimata]|uniref:GNAT family N-acetyltransferase n=1 Tax=Yinghuangia seranimata TaxID=408067 RepID=UPI00248AE9EB|nr:GNAT family N-acetyltransferase [Yinghuangia seranimata]MDI2132936.1 GNAT family N-acetyltransferase [Yinghuangia seranimata]